MIVECLRERPPPAARKSASFPAVNRQYANCESEPRARLKLKLIRCVVEGGELKLKLEWNLS